MNSERPVCGRVLDLHAAARRLRIPERTLRYRAGRGWIEGAFKQGKLWKFPPRCSRKSKDRVQGANRPIRKDYT